MYSDVPIFAVGSSESRKHISDTVLTDVLLKIAEETAEVRDQANHTHEILMEVIALLVERGVLENREVEAMLVKKSKEGQEKAT